MKPIETIFTNSKEVSCNGAKGSSTHPLIYLNMGDKNNVTCPYCSRQFIFRKSAKTKQSLN